MSLSYLAMVGDQKVADVFGTIATILLPMIPIPQLWHTYKSKSAKDLSLFYILIQIVANTSFMIFGIFDAGIYVWLPNGILVLMNMLLIILMQRYKGMQNDNDIGITDGTDESLIHGGI